MRTPMILAAVAAAALLAGCGSSSDPEPKMAETGPTMAEIDLATGSLRDFAPMPQTSGLIGDPGMPKSR